MLKIPSDIKFYTGPHSGYHVKATRAFKAGGRDVYQLRSVVRYFEVPGSAPATKLLTDYNGTGLYRNWCPGISQSDNSKVIFYYVAQGNDHSFESRDANDFNVIRTAVHVTDVFEFTNSNGKKVVKKKGEPVITNNVITNNTHMTGNTGYTGYTGKTTNTGYTGKPTNAGYPLIPGSYVPRSHPDYMKQLLTPSDPTYMKSLRDFRK
jgi:hypothetical protein